MGDSSAVGWVSVGAAPLVEMLLTKSCSGIGPLCAGMDRVFPGHGPSAAPLALFEKQRDYLLRLAAHVQELREGQAALSDAAKQELTRRLLADTPDAKLEFLIGLSADAIARELAAR